MPEDEAAQGMDPGVGRKAASSAGRLRLIVAIALVRLRFPLVLAAMFLVAWQWPVLVNYWRKLTRGDSELLANSPVSGSIEYFCPMCPGILSDWPAKCSVCNMALVSRSRSDAAVLPEGVVARMQISPYRLQLAGVRTTRLDYQELEYQVTALVRVSRPVAASGAVAQPAEVSAVGLVLARESAMMPAGTPVVLARLGAETTTFAGRVDAHDHAGSGAPGRTQVRVRVDDPRGELLDGMQLEATIRLPARQVEPRAIAAADDHDRVLALPETALIDTGRHKVVYVDRGAGMFDGVEVEVGPRCGALYPIVRGLAAGDRVATAGSLLLDAETRLNPSLAAGYFGAGRAGDSRADATGDRAPRQGPKRRAEIRKALASLSDEDRVLAARQKICPVTRQPLGSMGTPPAVSVAGARVLICCQGCEEALVADPQKYLANFP